MNKTLVVLLCVASLLLQGCWTTSMVKNPRYVDCASHHDRGRTGSTGEHYVTAVSANNRSCFGAEGGRLSQAKEQAMKNCKNSGSKDCIVFAENGRIVLAATVKDRDVDWDGTFTLLTLGMAGYVGYEGAKSGVLAPTTPIPTYTAPTTASKRNSKTCDGYPLQTFGSGPEGYTCRCTYGAGDSTPGWWAVRPGNPSGGVIACAAPSASFASNDGFRQELLQDFNIKSAGSGQVEVCIWDHECEDGDILSVGVNGQIFTAELLNRKQCRSMNINFGRNSIVATAVNGSGHKGNCSYANANTGSISVRATDTNSSSTRTYSVRGGAGTSASIIVTR